MTMARLQRVAQPQTPIGIDWSNPITQGLAIVRNGAQAQDVLLNTAPVSGSIAKTFGVAGNAASYTAASSDGYKYASGNLTVGACTVFALCMRRGQNASFGLRLYSDTDGTIASTSIANNPNTDDLLYAVNGPSGLKQNIATGFFTGFDNKPIAVLLTYNGQFNSAGSTDFQFFRNGVLQASTFNFAGTGSPSPRSTYSMFGNYALNPTGVPRAWNGDIYLGVVWNRVLSDAEIVSISANPWQVFQPIRKPIFVPITVTIIRPSSDVTTTGWTGTPDNTNLYTNIDEVTASDSDYITSPTITGGESIVFGLSSSIAAGTWDVHYRANYTGSSSQVRIHLVDAGGTDVGVGSWQTVTSTYALYTSSVTTTGTAVRVKIEVQ